jgi:hypothetical protein
VYLPWPLVPERMRISIPNVKLLVSLRDPVERAYRYANEERERGRGREGEKERRREGERKREGEMERWRGG